MSYLLVVKKDFFTSASAGSPCISSTSSKARDKRSVHSSRSVLLTQSSRYNYTKTENPQTHPTMCYSEHVFHSVCGHWGSTRVYQKCPNADCIGYERGCWNRQSTGSVSVQSSCDRCLFDPESITNRGTYLSVTQAQSGRTQVVVRRKSGTIWRYTRRSPSGFFEWRLQN